MNNQHTSQASILLPICKKGIWLLGIAFWLFGITDRSIVAFSDGYPSVVEFMQLFTAFFFFVGWLYMKQRRNFRNSGINDYHFS